MERQPETAPAQSRSSSRGIPISSATAALPTHRRNPTRSAGLWEDLPREWARNCNCTSASPTLLSHHLLKRGGTRVNTNEEEAMAWTTPMLVEICIGLEINGYLPAEF